MRRRTLEEKLEAIRLVEEGNSPRSVSDRLHKWYKQHRNESGTCPQTLFWVLVEEMLLKFELNYFVIIDMCEKASYFKTKNNTAANATKVTPLSTKLYFNFASTLLREF